MNELNDAYDEDDAYARDLELTRSWLSRGEAAYPAAGLDLDGLLRSRQRTRARTRRLGLALATTVFVAWLVSILAHPIAPVCDWVTAPDIIRYGVVHVVGFIIAAALFTAQRAWARMLVRACLWSSLLAASVGMWSEYGTLPVLMPVMALASALGLIYANRDDEDHRPEYEVDGFPLAAHRRAVVAMMVLGIADTETLLSAALNHDELETLGFAITELVCAASMLIALWGLYRLRGWGLLATLTLNLIIAALALSGRLIYDGGFALALAATALLQLALALPLLRTLLRGDVPTLRSRWTPPGWALHVALGIILAADALALTRGLQPERLARHCADT